MPGAPSRDNRRCPQTSPVSPGLDCSAPPPPLRNNVYRRSCPRRRRGRARFLTQRCLSSCWLWLEPSQPTFRSLPWHPVLSLLAENTSESGDGIAGWAGEHVCSLWSRARGNASLRVCPRETRLVGQRFPGCPAVGQGGRR
ncbi:guanine nucleotide-binding protein G(I)/G(S)/G(O) subunit gamma-7 isoform X1 [Camelus bactrianus]|uniref:Guanine nucleotide-binding protein G(I)/G(S)/G(O) subunit gamma-7 isoform X1 n=1 Tax=Camelus bactrianus TaxID=9837 RepID=A0AC58PB77_CAMBA